MFYLQKACEILCACDFVVLPICFAAVWVFGVINWCTSAYSKQNKLLEECRRKVVCNPKLAGTSVALLPPEYARQWRAYVNSGAIRPSLVFEFVAKPKKLRFLALPIVAAVVCLCYLAVFFADFSKVQYLVFQAAFALSFVVVLLVNTRIFAQREKFARQTFGRLVATLNAVGACDCTPDVLAQLNKLKDHLGDDALQKACELLHQNGLDTKRTVQQQKQINQALNGLVQAYSKRAAKNK